MNTVGFDERTWIDHFGNPHSEDMHLQERYHRLNRDTLEIVVTGRATNREEEELFKMKIEN